MKHNQFPSRQKLHHIFCAGLMSLTLTLTSTFSISPLTTEAAMTKQEQMSALKNAGPEDASTITINGNDIPADNINGLTYKGFGFLSANSTSDLLLDYKAEQPEAYAKLMQYLFGGEHPIMTHVKLEMGNDRNNSTGAEASTKRTAEEETNVRRNPGWQIAADAKKINPNVKVSILRWSSPAWVNTNEAIYTWYKEAILQAYETYGYMVDYVNPNVNEAWTHKNDVAFTKQYKAWILAESKETIPDDTERALYQKIKLIITDEAEQFSQDAYNSLQTDKAFRDAVSVAGYHYPNEDTTKGGMKVLAEDMDMEVWSSENQATFSNSAFRPANNVSNKNSVGTGIGGDGSALEMGNYIIKGFTESRRTHIVYQPAVGSFYEGGQYSFKELVSARDPWSGWMHYDAGLLVLSHLSRFAVTGWENETNTAGIWRAIASASDCTVAGTRNVNGHDGGDSYLTLAAPDGSDFTTLLVNDSEYTKNYAFQLENLNLSTETLDTWETRAADDGAYDENYMQYRGALSKDSDGKYHISVKPWSVVTVTSLDQKASPELTEGLPKDGERTVLDTDSTGSKQDTESKYLYADDFDYTGKTVPVLDGKGGFTEETEDYITSRGGKTGAIARYTNTINGAFEAYQRADGEYVLRQQLDAGVTGKGGSWNSGDPAVLIGDFRWTNYAASVDVIFENTTVQTPYACIAIRQTGREAKLERSSGYTLKVSYDGAWELYRLKTVVQSGQITDPNIFAAGYLMQNNLRLEGAGSTIRAYINGNLITAYEDSEPITSGRIGLGCGFHYTEFDNLQVTKLKGETPYYTELIDNMEIYDLTPEKNEKLSYNDLWSHQCGQGMYVYQRTMSYSTEQGASLTYTFKGTGLEVLGSSKGGTSLEVTVDGTKLSGAQKTQNASELCANYSLTGLSYGEHTVTLTVTDGKYNIDAIGILGAPAEQGETAADIQPSAPILLPGASAPIVPEPASQETEAPAAPASPASSDAITTAAAITATDTAVSAGLKKRDIVKSGSASYKVTDAKKKTVAYQKPSKKTITSASVPNTVKLKGADGKAAVYKVTAVAANAFKGCSRLKSVTIGKNVKTIGKNAFNGCAKLKQIKLKTTVLSKVGSNAIKGIQKKAVITCPKKNKKAYKKLFTAKTGYKKTMKIK